jgi:TPP-dependent indolepyruvate ferredoxin oxidoreductase alpha subunit
MGAPLRTDERSRDMALTLHTVETGTCEECPFCYDTIECVAPTGRPNPHPTCSWNDTKKPADCPLRGGQIVVRLSEEDL